MRWPLRSEITPAQLPFLAAAILAIAFLYPSVGHASVSSYVAVVSLFSVVPELIGPTALALNKLVVCLASWQFWRVGYFSRSL